MVIPVRDENPLRRTPWVTYTLIAVNVAVLLLTPGAVPSTASHAAVTCRQDAFYERYGAIPHELITDRPLAVVETGRVVSTSQGLACQQGHPDYRKQPVLSVLEAMFVRIPAWLVLGLWFVLQWAYAVGQPRGSTVAYVAHVFGFLAGMLAGLLLRAGRAGSTRA